jgi:hypothetical protein
VVVPNIPVGGYFTTTLGAIPITQTVYLPISIVKGSRLAARCQGSAGTQTLLIVAHLIAGGPLGPASYSTCRALGINPATSKLVSCDPGGTANTKGSWTEIVASTEFPIRYAILYLSHRDVATPAASGSHYVDIGIGAAASESIIVADLWRRDNVDILGSLHAYPMPLMVPKGVRIAARAQSSVIDAEDRLSGVGLLAFS